MKRAFTLIELLVVIAIIGIISAIVVTSMEGARAQARDAARIAKAQQLSKALEMYYADNGYYPQLVHTRGYTVSGTTCNTSVNGEPYQESWGHCSRWKLLSIELEPFIKMDPADYTEAEQGDYFFNYASQSGDNWQSYGLEVRLETNHPNKTNDGGVHDNFFELGQTPRYCASKYSGDDAEWLDKSGAYTNICKGGS